MKNIIIPIDLTHNKRTNIFVTFYRGRRGAVGDGTAAASFRLVHTCALAAVL